MSTILTVILLSVPIVGGAGYLLRYYPRQTVIIAGEATLYAVTVFGYLALTLVLVPLTAPIGLQVLSIASSTALALALAPGLARRLARRLRAAEETRLREQRGDQPG